MHLPGGNTNLLVKGSITVPSTSRQTGLELAVVDVNRKIVYNQAKLAYREVDGTLYFPLQVG
jgi:hypothetical protein